MTGRTAWIAPVRMLLLGIASATALLAQLDAREIIRRAVAADGRNWKLARNYTFSERVDLRRLDAEGHVDSEELKTYVVQPLEGSSYRLLTARDDRPLPASEEQQEQEKLARNIVERQNETEAQRIDRVAMYERPEWQRDVWRELPEAFDFRLSKDEVLSGQKLFVIHAAAGISAPVAHGQDISPSPGQTLDRPGRLSTGESEGGSDACHHGRTVPDPRGQRLACGAGADPGER
jgi:hypothetical protein